MSSYSDEEGDRNSLKLSDGAEPHCDLECFPKSDNKKVVVPDGGWGWMCVFAAFVINVIIDGCSYSFGILFADLVDYFDASRSRTAWIGSLFAAVPLLAGPIASIITNKLGYRKATIVGGFVTFCGFVCSFFVNSIEGLYVTYGIIAGLGISLPYLNSIVVVAEYFEKKRSLATGLAECGAGVGTLIFAPILEQLITKYGWRGAILIMGAVVSNIIVCGCVFRPLRFKNKLDGTCASSLISTFEKETDDTSQSVLVGLGCQKKNREGCIVDKDYRQHRLQHPNGGSVCSIQFFENGDGTFMSSSISSLPHMIRASRSMPQVNDKIVLTTKKVDKRCKCNKSFVDISVMKNPTLVAFTCTNVMLYFWYDVPYVFTVDRAKYVGISETQASIVVACIGVLHTIGNILFGFLGDRTWVNRFFLYCGALISCGASLIFVPFCPTYTPTLILAGLFGLFSAAADALCSVIIVDIIGVDKLTDAFGIVMFLQGVANLIGPPFAGYLFDTSGAYDNTFWSAGFCVMAVSALFMVIPVWRKCKRSRE